MGFIKRLFGIEERAEEENTLQPIIEGELLRMILDGGGISKSTALGIPAIASSVNLISSIVANINYKLYTYDNSGRLIEKEDIRTRLVNKNTGDLLNGYEMKRAFIRDYLLSGNGYIYKSMYRNKVESLHYVDAVNVSVSKSADPIFKSATYNVNSNTYYPHEFITIARNSTDGVTGKGLLQENRLVIKLIDNMLDMLNNNVSGGGLKKGFLNSERTLSEPEMEYLKETFRKIYTNEGAAVVVLNKGIKFDPAVESSTEMQLKEMYDGISDDVSEILNVPENIKKGTANKEEYRNWFKNCINPIASEMTAALNETMLLESEKEKCFWKADTSELENGDIKDQLEAYKIGLESNIIQLDEARSKLGLEPLGFNFIKLGLDTVLCDPKRNVIYTPNTNMLQDMNEMSKGLGSKIDNKDNQ